jgi:hypothetical protein
MKTQQQSTKKNNQNDFRIWVLDIGISLEQLEQLGQLD